MAARRTVREDIRVVNRIGELRAGYDGPGPDKHAMRPGGLQPVDFGVLIAQVAQVRLRRDLRASDLLY